MLSFLKRLFGSKTKDTITKIKTKKVEGDYSQDEYTFDEIVESWKRSYVKLNEIASNELITYAQGRLNFIFPTDFINFYKQFNGFSDCDMIGDMFSIWPLERIMDEYIKSDDKNFIPFCDYMFDIHRIGYLKNNSAVFKDYDQSIKVANSFEETIKLIEKDSSLLY